MDTLTLIAITTAALIVIGGITALNFAWRQQKRSKRLQKQFGKEPAHTLDEMEDETAAEVELAERLKHSRSLNIIPLTGEQTTQYMTEWEHLEARLEKEPVAVARDTEHLIRRAMHAKGYPVESYDQFISDMSVDYPDHVTKYQDLHDLVATSEAGTTGGTDLRRAVLRCKALIEEILDVTTVEKSYQNTR